MNKQVKKSITKIFVLKNKYEQNIEYLLHELYIFEIKYGNLKMSKRLQADYVRILSYVSIEILYYNEMCKKHKFPFIDFQIVSHIKI